MTAPALDPSVIQGLRQLTPPGEPDVLLEVLTLFRDGASQRLAAIRAACEARDSGALQRTAHDFKGAAATIGALPLQQCCRDLELAGKSGRLEHTKDLLARLDAEYARLEETIEGLVA